MAEVVEWSGRIVTRVGGPIDVYEIVLEGMIEVRGQGVVIGVVARVAVGDADRRTRGRLTDGGQRIGELAVRRIVKPQVVRLTRKVGVLRID